MNLLTALEVAAFILDKYKDRSFYNIIIIKRREDSKEPLFYTINYINTAYFLLYYILLFL